MVSNRSEGDGKVERQGISGGRAASMNAILWKRPNDTFWYRSPNNSKRYLLPCLTQLNESHGDNQGWSPLLFAFRWRCTLDNTVLLMQAACCFPYSSCVCCKDIVCCIDTICFINNVCSIIYVYFLHKYNTFLQ